MIGKKFPFQIVIIDEGVDLNTVKKEYPSFQGKISVMTMGRSYNYTKDIHGLPINHGTLCTLLLIEALQLYQEEKQTEIICIPITDENGKKTLENLLDALEYCTRVDVQMICMSLGVQDIFAGRKLLNIIKKMKKTSILAAAANDFTIAYPAVFRDVIGIKRSISFLEKIQVIRNPVDGIDLIAPYVETQLLKKLREQFHLDYSESNSIIVPKMAALFLHKNRYKSTDDYSKNFILNLLKEDSENIFESKVYQMPELLRKTNEDIPIVLVEYLPSEYIEKKQAVKKLQKELEELNYCCFVLCDRTRNSNFENAWYALAGKHEQDLFRYYRQILNSGLILLMLEKGSSFARYADLEIFKKDKSSETDRIENALVKIIKSFGDEAIEYEKR